MSTRITIARDSIWQHTRTAVLKVIVLTVLLGIVYPLAMTGLSQLIFPSQANGSLVRDSAGNVVGSALLGQNFSNPEYFHPRPSAAGTDGYDATSSGGSNLGPTNQKLIDTARDRATAYREENGLVVLTMMREDYEHILLALAYYLGSVLSTTGDGMSRHLGVINRLNQGNPEFTPYEIDD